MQLLTFIKAADLLFFFLLRTTCAPWHHLKRMTDESPSGSLVGNVIFFFGKAALKWNAVSEAKGSIFDY